MHRRTYLIALLFLCFWLVGCATGATTAEPTVEPPIGYPIATATMFAPAEPTPINETIVTLIPAQEPSPTEEPSPMPEPVPSPAVLPELAGLLYQSAEGHLYLMNKMGEPLFLLDRVALSANEASFAPDKIHLVYSAHDDLWLTELGSEEVQQLTNTPDVQEASPQWWHARPGVIVFHYVPLEEMGPWNGYIAAYDTATGETQIIAGPDERPHSGAALSPDGETVAYAVEDGLRLWRWGQGSEAFPLASLVELPGAFREPAWSPDGTKLAWKFYGEYDPATASAEDAVAIFDLEQETVQWLHPYTSAGGGEAFGSIQWSPDGQWLSVVNSGESERVSLWAIRADGSEEHALGRAESALWGPDSRHLLYMEWPEGSDSFMDALIKQFEVGGGEPQIVELPAGSWVQAWMELAPLP
ncbi:MAG: PD40 domain-containing protein [Ardenticatenales bacterium]|nr:PD40 domain-containing protein [Ardenticatenales bacterium]